MYWWRWVKPDLARITNGIQFHGSHHETHFMKGLLEVSL